MQEIYIYNLAKKGPNLAENAKPACEDKYKRFNCLVSIHFWGIFC